MKQLINAVAGIPIGASIFIGQPAIAAGLQQSGVLFCARGPNCILLPLYTGVGSTYFTVNATGGSVSVTNQMSYWKILSKDKTIDYVIIRNAGDDFISLQRIDAETQASVDQSERFMCSSLSG